MRTPLALGALALAAGAAALVLPSTPRPPSGVEARLPALIAFVEAERGLELRREVDLRVLDDEEFVEALNEDPYAALGVPVREDGDAQDLPDEDRAATYAAFGLADAEDYHAQRQELSDETVVGFYDGVRERLVVRETSGPYLDVVLVHELVHVLQDQWFMTDRPTLGYETEASLAFSSLVEGDALRVERAWYASLDADDKRAVDEVDPEVGEPVTDDGRLTDPLESTFAFPYAAGPPLVAHLLATGGQEALDAAFRDPPLTTEQVLHPREAQESPVVPPAPESDGEVVDEGVLGERGLALLVAAEPLAPGGPQVGWEGDSYRTHRLDDGRLCTVARVLMRDTAARDRLAAALEEWDVEVVRSAGPSLDLRSCTDPEA